MITSGWVTMVLSVGFVTLLLGWCIYRVVKEPGAPKHMHAQGEIDTHDGE